MHGFRNFRWSLFLLSLAAVGLVGCGGGGGDDDDEDWDFDADASGIWRGSITPDGGGSAGTATLIAIPNGRFNMSSTVALFTGTGATSDSAFVGTGTGFSPGGSTFGNGATSATFTFNGQVAELSVIQGAYSGGGISGTFNLEYSRALTDRPASLSLVNGNYAVQTGEGGPTVSIDINNGALTYTSSTGCVANGSIQPVESSRNMYSWNMTLSASCVTTGLLTGLAFMPDSTRVFLTGSGSPGPFSALGVK